MRFCSDQVEAIAFRSKSNPSKMYEVELRPADSAHPKCGCMAWIMSRSRARSAVKVISEAKNQDLPGKCKHVDQAKAMVCDWEADFPPEAFVLDENGEVPCPKCGRPTVERVVAHAS